MKIEELTKQAIESMSREEHIDLLLNYGVSLKDRGIDISDDKLLNSALDLKKRSDEKKNQAKKEQEKVEVAPDVTPEERKDPVKSLFEMGYETHDDVLRALQSIKLAKQELERKQQETDEKLKDMKEEEMRLAQKRKDIDKKCKELEQEYKTWQLAHDKLIAAKKSS